ncbi:MAG: hypothetical protein AAFZ63_27435, partial [Bacteroidota bacterium]
MDNTWVLGYAGADEEQDSFGLAFLTFFDNQLSISGEVETAIRIRINNSSISNTDGNLLLFTNGLAIHNSSQEIIENGDSMYIGEFDLGYDYPQSTLMLPAPGNEDQIIIVSTFASWATTVIGDQLLYSVVDLSANHEEGTVIIKNELLLDDNFGTGKLVAVRHANGRDWWMIYAIRNSNRFVRFLISPEGVQQVGDQVVGEAHVSGFGQAQFSPDGRIFVHYNAVNVDTGTFAYVYEFDRCSGLLDYQITIPIPLNGASGGAAISKSSEFLYVNTTNVIYQYDLMADDILASEDIIAVYDGFLDFLPTTFFMGSLARDGKIYVSSPNGVLSLTVVEYPDRRGEACSVNQHAIKLPVYN